MVGTELKSFFYLYGVGGALFLGTFILAYLRGSFDLKSNDDRRVVIFLLVGYAAYIGFHAITQFILPGSGGTP
ncbi:MAG: hypothetical protein KC944_18170 [Candidatus Omnitrophica bacterium]|nr:hypothetical protein [Candidatus Omnitrophota bacterium]